MRGTKARALRHMARRALAAGAVDMHHIRAFYRALKRAHSRGGQ